MVYRKIVFFFSCILICISCAENLDFKQIEEYRNTPVISSSLINFKILPIQFFDASGINSVSEITDLTNFEIFNNAYIFNKTVKIELEFYIKNEFDRSFLTQVEFLDENGIIIHRFTDMNISANNEDYSFIEAIELSTTPNLIYTSRIRINVKIENSLIPLSQTSTSKFEFKSSINIYLDSDA